MTERLLTNHLVSFLLWLIATALLVLDVIYGRLLLMALAGVIGWNHWVMSFMDRASILILGLLALGLALYFEHYFRQSIAKRRLWPRFLRIAAIELLIILLGVVVSWLTS
ncbi:MAG: hypothetical protein KDE54_06110 [Caldilineaceae bacterium]|nr:hypothetical protein [Caldilineaceae bacterium]MCB0138288.1 hypothetical protein [Caldilineaceae bacterium]